MIVRAFDERDGLKVHQKTDRDYVTEVDQSECTSSDFTRDFPALS
jgi:hypothetical protein